MRGAQWYGQVLDLVSGARLLEPLTLEALCCVLEQEPLSSIKY